MMPEDTMKQPYRRVSYVTYRLSRRERNEWLREAMACVFSTTIEEMRLETVPQTDERRATLVELAAIAITAIVDFDAESAAHDNGDDL